MHIRSVAPSPSRFVVAALAPPPAALLTACAFEVKITAAAGRFVDDIWDTAARSRYDDLSTIALDQSRADRRALAGRLMFGS
jgi:hypothetical protein